MLNYIAPNLIISSYNTLLKHSRDFEKILAKREIKVSDTIASAADIKRFIIPSNFYNPELAIIIQKLLAVANHFKHEYGLTTESIFDKLMIIGVNQPLF
jgi:hypothetical protein